MKKRIVYALFLAAAVFFFCAAPSCDDPYIKEAVSTGNQAF